ncbi:MAG TPA: DUF5658 family protein [Vicinamibacterales bacterium]|nr:DUF5658 family protein [Vicinamibacterales bacterium]
MTITALSLALTMSMSSAAPSAEPAARVAEPRPAPSVTRTAAAPAPAAGPVERWRLDLPEKRPSALPVMYAAFGALQMADAYSTRRAVTNGAREANPLMQEASQSSGAMYAVKAASAAASIYFAEKAWKKNRKGAVILMAAINGVTAAVVARNLRNAK